MLTAHQEILVGSEVLLARLHEARSGEARRLSQELSHVERAIARCLDYITSGDGAPGLVRETLASLETRKQALELALAAQPAAPVITLHPNYPEIYRRKVAELAGLLAAETTRAEAMAAIRRFIDRVEVGPRDGAGRVAVTLVGALAGILSFAQGRTQKHGTAAQGLDDGTFLTVAGARNLRELTGWV